MDCRGWPAKGLFVLGTLGAACGQPARPGAGPIVGAASSAPAPVADAAVRPIADAGVDASDAAATAVVANGLLFEEAASIRALAQDAENLYLGTSGGVVVRSKRGDARAQLSGALSFTDGEVVASGGDAYWSSYGSIFHASRSGADAAPRFPGNGAAPRDLRLEGTVLYWSAVDESRVPRESRIMRGETTSGAVETLWSGPGTARLLAADEARLYVAVARPHLPEQHLQIAKRGGAVTPWIPGVIDATTLLVGVAAEGGRLFVAVSSRSDLRITARAADGGAGFAVERSGQVLYALGGAGASRLVGDMCPLTPAPGALGRHAQGLRVATPWIYWSCSRAGPDTIHRVPLAGGAVQTVVTVDTATVRSMAGTPLTNLLVDFAVDGQRLYWAESAWTDPGPVRVLTLSP